MIDPNNMPDDPCAVCLPVVEIWVPEEDRERSERDLLRDREFWVRLRREKEAQRGVVRASVDQPAAGD